MTLCSMVYPESASSFAKALHAVSRSGEGARGMSSSLHFSRLISCHIHDNSESDIQSSSSSSEEYATSPRPAVVGEGGSGESLSFLLPCGT